MNNGAYFAIFAKKKGRIMEEKEIAELIRLRRFLHANPEVSEDEANTANIIAGELEKIEPDEIIRNIGGYGVAAVFEGGEPGKTVAFRAELDALPIPEANDFEYKSKKLGVGHKCGHDGHMTILVGLARRIVKAKPFPGRLVLMFQPAEETAQGAKQVVKDGKFVNLNIDRIFGLHNLPGFPLGSIIARKGAFASASKGFAARLNGLTSHAGHPENGRSPVLSMTSLIHSIMALPHTQTNFNKANSVTIIHARLGEIAFGTAPGEAEVMATLRSNSDDDLNKMGEEAERLTKGIAESFNLKYHYDWREVFPVTASSDAEYNIALKAANNLNREIIHPEHPFPWSEDFGYFTQKIDGAFFGLGSGEGHPQLHNDNYDFPDELIEKGIDIFEEIFKLSAK